MDIFSIFIIVLGLVLFETITSVDNAIINAQVLSTMNLWARKWFLCWGILFAVFIVRGLLPLLIVYFTVPSLGFLGALTATFSSDVQVVHAIEKSAPTLLMGGGIFLIFLFLHWLFVDEKNYCFKFEEFFYRQNSWFFAVVSIILAIIVWFSLKINDLMAFGAVVGSTAFFISHGFQDQAEKTEKSLINKNVSDWSKILYLEVLDTTFSIDGVLGAFAFTLSVPLILIGNGIGAIVVRQITVSNIERIKQYLYLKNGAMYSIFILGCFMILESFGISLPSWISPITTFILVGFFFCKSVKRNKVLPTT